MSGSGDIRRTVETILRHRFGPKVSFDPNVPRVLTQLIREGISLGCPPIRGGIKDDPAFARFRDALLALEKELPAQLQQANETLGDFRAAGNIEAVRRFEPKVRDLQQLAEVVARVAVGTAPARRKADPRSDWRPTARAFASIIERGLAPGCKARMSRKSVSSQLVITVLDLLREAGIKQKEVVIVDALKPLKADKEAVPVDVFLAEVAGSTTLPPTSLVKLSRVVSTED
jgi:hypothetical protein